MPVLDGDFGLSDGSHGADDIPSSEPVPPTMLRLYRDVYDDKGNAVGRETVGWGLSMPGGPAFTVSVWLTPDDAATALDARITTVDPPYVAQSRAAEGAGR